MTPLGTLLFSLIGALIVAGVGTLIWRTTRDNSDMQQTLQRDGWAMETQPGTTQWRARRTRQGIAASIDVTASGVHNKTVWTSVRVATDTRTDDVLVERKLMPLIAADGALAASVGFKPPPRWRGGAPAFVADYNAYASSDDAAARWLPQANQNAILEYNNSVPRKISVRFFDGAIEGRWAEAPQNAAQLEGVLSLLERLRRARK
jgi:hypothetical protein